MQMEAEGGASETVLPLSKLEECGTFRMISVARVGEIVCDDIVST